MLVACLHACHIICFVVCNLASTVLLHMKSSASPDISLSRGCSCELTKLHWCPSGLVVYIDANGLIILMSINVVHLSCLLRIEASPDTGSERTWAAAIDAMTAAEPVRHAPWSKNTNVYQLSLYYIHIPNDVQRQPAFIIIVAVTPRAPFLRVERLPLQVSGAARRLRVQTFEQQMGNTCYASRKGPCHAHLLISGFGRAPFHFALFPGNRSQSASWQSCTCVRNRYG